MLYPKPKMKYTDMAIYICKHMYEDNMSPEVEYTIYVYLYHLAYMLSWKAKYFKNSKYYDDFAVYCASNLLIRIKNPKQWEYKSDGTPKVKKIKNILNYMKRVLYPFKVDFEQENYCQTVTKLEEESSVYLSDYNLANKIIYNSNKELNFISIKDCLSDVAITIKNFIQKTPYKKDPVILNNIYISCLLTFINSVTLPNYIIDKMKQNNKKVYPIENLYFKQNQNCVVLFHLDESMRDYIYILTKEIKSLVAKDIALSLNKNIVAEELVNNLIISEVNDLNVYTEDNY